MINIEEKRERLVDWINPNNRLPNESNWFICHVNGVRLPLRFNKPNSFWSGLDGKCYKANEIDKWLDV